MPTLQELFRTLTFSAGYNTSLVIGGTTLLGLAAGIVGVFALLRKRSLTADALSHATLPGIALAFLIAPLIGLSGRSLPVLLIGATISGIVGVLTIQWLLRVRRIHEDAAIGIVLSVFFGMGIIALSYIQTNASAHAAGLKTLIYGQTAAMQQGDALLLGGIAALAILAAVLLTKEFALVCFNDAFARVCGWPVGVIDLLMMSLVVVVTVAGLQSVGILLVVAMLILPAVSARFWTDRLWTLLVLAGLFGALSGYLGSSLSAMLPRKPAGAVIVLTGGGLFALSFLFAPKRGVLSIVLQRIGYRFQTAGDHVLEEAYSIEISTSNKQKSSINLEQIESVRSWQGWLRFLVLRSLALRGRIRLEPSGLRLTEQGRADGQRIDRNHRLWKQYLVDYADIAPSHVDWSVDLVEHVLSEQIISELEASIGLSAVATHDLKGGQA